MRHFRFTFVAACAAIATAIMHCVPAVAAAPLPYAVDPTFNGGRYYVDAFASSANLDYVGKKIVKLDNGDVVVAGIVPDLRGGNVGSLGLVRYNAAGQRVAWSHPGDVGFDGNQYVVFNTNGLVPHGYDDVKAIKMFDDRLFVLVETEDSGLNNTFPISYSFRGYAADVIVFGLDGAYLGQTEVGFADASSGDARTFFAGGIAVYNNNITVLHSPNSLVFGGYRVDNGISKPVFHRFVVNDDSTFTEQTALVSVDPSGGCASGCEVNDLALGNRPTLTSPPRIYLGGSHLYSNKNWDFAAMRVSTNGVPDHTFGISGLAVQPFNLAGGSLEDHGRQVVVVPGTADQIYVGGDVSVNCGDGVGIVKFTSTGGQDTTFGPGSLGRLTFGGNYSSSSICVIPRTDNRFHAFAVDGAAIALVGERDSGSIFIGSGSQTSADSTFAQFDTGGASVPDFFKVPFTDVAGQSRTRDSGLWGVVPTGNGSFTASGLVDNGHAQFATLRFARLVDEIFSNRFGD